MVFLPKEFHVTGYTGTCLDPNTLLWVKPQYQLGISCGCFLYKKQSEMNIFFSEALNFLRETINLLVFASV